MNHLSKHPVMALAETLVTVNGLFVTQQPNGTPKEMVEVEKIIDENLCVIESASNDSDRARAINELENLAAVLLSFYSRTQDVILEAKESLGE